MNIYLWRHNKTYHSHSMIDEPCLNNEFYLDTLAIVVARDLEEALAKLAEQNAVWRIDDLRALPCQVIPVDKASVIFTELRGMINHL